MSEPVPSGAQRVGGALRGGCLGTLFGFFCLILALGAGSFPIVGLVFGVGFAGLGLISPFVGAWLGYRGVTAVNGRS